SVGAVTEPNAHPVNADEIDQMNGPYVTAVLNGDIENFADLKASTGLHNAPEIMTDAKIIPTMLSRALADGQDRLGAFRDLAGRFDGSIAFSTVCSSAPDRIQIAVRGGSQSLYIGLDEDVVIA